MKLHNTISKSTINMVYYINVNTFKLISEYIFKLLNYKYRLMYNFFFVFIENKGLQQLGH